MPPAYLSHPAFFLFLRYDASGYSERLPTHPVSRTKARLSTAFAHVPIYFRWKMIQAWYKDKNLDLHETELDSRKIILCRKAVSKN